MEELHRCFDGMKEVWAVVTVSPDSGSEGALERTYRARTYQEPAGLALPLHAQVSAAHDIDRKASHSAHCKS